MSKLYIFTGLPYAGKTTLTKELVKRFNFEVASVDSVIDEKGFEVEQMSQEDWNLVYTIAYEKIRKLLSEGKTVIFDMGNLKRRERENARNIAKESRAESRLIYINTPLEEIKMRRLKNQETGERGYLEDATMNRALGMFEGPSEDENPILYNSNMNLDNWIKENIT